jgi:hypothetical protein
MYVVRREREFRTSMEYMFLAPPAASSKYRHLKLRYLNIR